VYTLSYLSLARRGHRSSTTLCSSVWPKLVRAGAYDAASPRVCLVQALGLGGSYVWNHVAVPASFLCLSVRHHRLISRRITDIPAVTKPTAPTR